MSSYCYSFLGSDGLLRTNEQRTWQNSLRWSNSYEIHCQLSGNLFGGLQTDPFSPGYPTSTTFCRLFHPFFLRDSFTVFSLSSPSFYIMYYILLISVFQTQSCFVFPITGMPETCYTGCPLTLLTNKERRFLREF